MDKPKNAPNYGTIRSSASVVDESAHRTIDRTNMRAPQGHDNVSDRNDEAKIACRIINEGKIEGRREKKENENRSTQD